MRREEQAGASRARLLKMFVKVEHGIERSRQTFFQLVFHRCDTRRYHQERIVHNSGAKLGVHMTITACQAIKKKTIAS